MAWRTALSIGAATFLLPSLWAPLVLAGNTTCASSQLDWYTSVVGETPCRTYERLRQICNSDYQVPDFRSSPPGDQCDDQVSACCCNTVAFQLSMLCMNCQYLTVPGDISTGVDAAAGSYNPFYLQTCGSGTNNSLPTDIQTAVCNKGIRLDDYLYGGWDDGSWFYIYTKENANKEHAVNNNNTFTHCANDIVTSSSSSSTSTLSSQTPTSAGDSATQTADQNGDSGSSSSSSSKHAAAIVGGVVGGAGAIVLGVIGFCFWRRQRRYGAGTPATPDGQFSYTYREGHPSMSSSVPFSSGIVAASASTASPPYDPYSPGGSERPSTHAHTFSNDSGSSQPPWAPAAAPSMYSYNSNTLSPTGTGASANTSSLPLRHLDGGPIADLARSPSGRLPPAYRSWERDTDSGSNSGAGSQLSAPQSFGYGVGMGAVGYGFSESAQMQPQPSQSQVPLVPLRRLQTKEEAARGAVNRGGDAMA